MFKNKFSLTLFSTLNILLFWGQAPTVLADAVCNTDIPESTPTSNFTESADGKTVSDNFTGLMWAKCTNGTDHEITPCVGESAAQPKVNWKKAIESGALSTLADYDDWRLPNIKEIQTLVERQCHSPAINETVFDGKENMLDICYWTSTPASTEGENAWSIDFRLGIISVIAKDTQCHVRFVRGGI